MLASTTMKNTCLLIYHLLDRLETDNIIRCITEKVKIIIDGEEVLSKKSHVIGL